MAADDVVLEVNNSPTSPIRSPMEVDEEGNFGQSKVFVLSKAHANKNLTESEQDLDY